MMRIRDRHIINSFDVFSLSQMLYCCYEAFGSWIQKVLGERSIVLFTPFFCFFVFLGGISCRFTKADEPWKVDELARLNYLKWGWKVRIAYTVAIFSLRLLQKLDPTLSYPLANFY